MAATPKPTKQQIAQAKARAGGNNPIKVTDAGLKKLGKAAVTAATLLPAGRAVKAVTTAAKTAKTAKRIPAAYAQTKKAVPVKVVKKTTPPIYKYAQTDAILEQQWAKSVKAAEKMGMDIKKMKITIDGRTIDYKGIR
jgi:hypothetical protein